MELTILGAQILIQSLAAIQAALAVLILYLLVLYAYPTRVSWLYAGILLLFILLKFQIIVFSLGGQLDQFLWGMYNICNSLFIVYILIKHAWKK